MRPLRYRGAGRAVAAGSGLVLLAACSGDQSTLDPKGPVAEAIAATWWVMFWGASAVVVLVMGLVLVAMFAAPERRRALPQTAFLVGAGLVFPIVMLTALLVYGTDVGQRITTAADEPLRIEVTGHQWWWEVRYPAQGDAPEVLTANELRLPVGVPVEFTILSADVVHSFWIPNLGGKVDMIPGRRNTLRLQADVAGRFRGQCSEFCGAQHARMGFIAIAEPAADFDAWRRERARPASAGALDRAGLERFGALGCGDCHAIAGTPHAGVGGPVLDHFGDRPTIGGGTAANTPGALRAWLADHGRTMKPGSHGPEQRELDAADVDVITALLEGLR